MKGMKESPFASHHLPDTKQNWWQLASIQLAGWMSLPTLATSILVLKQNSFFGSVLTIIVANAILWFIRVQIVAMSYEKRQSTLDISRSYFGNFGTYFIAALLLISTLVWFITQTTIAGETLTHLVSLHEDPQIDQFTQMSVLLGIITSVLCMEGIGVLRRLSTYCFPILIAAFFTILLTLPKQPLSSFSNAPLSLAGLTLVLSTNLGLSSDLPTFFRHSKSWVESLNALTVIQILNMTLGLLSLYLGSLIVEGFRVNEQLVVENSALQISLLVFIFFSVICANVANVYSSSVGWEILAPKSLVGRKEYFILGLGLTTIFILVYGLLPMDFLLTVSDISLVNLCIILVIGSQVSRLQGKLPDRGVQTIYFLAWFGSTLLNCFDSFASSAWSPFVVNLAVISMIIFPSLLTISAYRIFQRKRR